MLIFFIFKDLGFCHLGSSYDFNPISLQLEKDMSYVSVVCFTCKNFIHAVLYF